MTVLDVSMHRASAESSAPRRAGLVLLLLLIAGQALLVARSLGVEGRTVFGGDEPEYAETARGIQRLLPFGTGQTSRAPEQRLGIREGNSDWRPIGYPLVAAIVTLPSIDADWARARIAAFQFVLAAAAAVLSYGLVTLAAKSSFGSLLAAAILGFSPWTFSYVLLIGPESLTGSLTTIGAVTLTWSVGGSGGGHRPRWGAFAGAVVLLSTTLVLRPENVVLVPFVVAGSLFLSGYRRLMLYRLAAVGAVAFLAVVGVQIGYRKVTRGRWELFGKPRFFNEGAFHWLDTWPNTEKQAFDGFAYLLAGGKASAEALPDRAFANPREKERIVGALARLRLEGRYGPEIDAVFREVASERRRRDPIGNLVVPRLWRSLHLWLNAETNTQLLDALSRGPRWLSRAVVAGTLLWKGALLVLAAIAALVAGRAIRRGRDGWLERLVVLVMAYAVLRTSLVGLVLVWSVPRYAQAAWPGVIVAAAAAALWLAESQAERRGRSSPVEGDPVRAA